MPFYNGEAIFGFGVVMATGSEERDKQINVFPGRQGVERVDLGRRGRITTVQATHGGPNPAALAFAQQLFRSYQDGLAYTLIDTLGLTWDGCVLEAFNPQGRIMRSGTGQTMQAYTAEIRHLI